MAINIKSFISQMGRVWTLLKKPSGREFRLISLVSAIGLGVIGIMGFVIAIIMNLVYPK